jgi:cysteine-rich repeat protein
MAHVGGCGDGVLDGGEACDDGNTLSGDGCNSNCRIRLCRTPPSDACFVAEKGSLSVHEKERKRFVAEGFSTSLSGFDGATTVDDFGQPLFNTTRYDICVYDGSDALVAQMIVPRGFDVCGKKQKGCWQPIRDTGYKFSDPDLDSAGIGSIIVQSGDAGKGSVRVKGKRKKDEDQLPRMTGNLQNSTKARVQVMVSDGSCFSVELPNVKHADEGRFQATQ